MHHREFDVQVSTNARLHCNELGQGFPVLLVQGTGIEGRGWAPQCAALSTGYRVICFDNRGIGKSSTIVSPASLTIERMALDALAILDQLEITSCHWVGHSLGGLIAATAAALAPHRVRSLSLLCTAARGRDIVLHREMVLPAIATAIGTRSMRRMAFARLVSSKEQIARIGIDAVVEQLEAAFGRRLDDAPGAVPWQMLAMWKHTKPIDLKIIEGRRVLVVAADEDVIAPVRLNRALVVPGSNSHIAKGAGHAVPIQHADLINELILRHLQANA